MARLGFVCSALTWLLLVGCGSSHSTTDDAGITFDAVAPGTDAGQPDGAPPPPICGDGVLMPMEQCDDENLVPGDGCDEMCRRESFCGDGTMDAGEVCDDGNNRSGDGCRSDCQSDESCGNGVRDVRVGEQCDDGNTRDGDGCSGDCRILESCGDGAIDDTLGETCDDGNTDAFDGCGSDCRDEISLVIDSLLVGDEMTGCDYSGDGRPDNSFAEALGPLIDLLNEQLVDSIGTDIILLLSFLGLDDPRGVDDDSLTVAWLPGSMATSPGEYFADMAAFDDEGNAVTTFESRLRSRMLSGGPEDVEIPLMFFLPLELRQGRISGTTDARGGTLSSLTDALLCGAVPISTFALLPLPPIGPLGDSPPCDGSENPPNLADILIGGLPIFGLRGTQPDVDLDGDGLEAYEVDRRGPAGCQPVIINCFDGDGTVVPGRGCAMDAAFEDGFSTGLPFTASEATIVGFEGGAVPPPMP